MLNEKSDVFFLGDWLLYAQEIEENSIDLIVSDSPFGVGLENNTHFNDRYEYVEEMIDDWMKEMHRVLKEYQHIYLYVPTLKIDLFLTAFKRYFVLFNILTCNTYTKNTYMENNFGFEAQHILYGTKGLKPNKEMNKKEKKDAKANARRLNKVNYVKASKTWRKDKRNPDPKKYTYQYPNIFPMCYKANIKTNEHKNRNHPTEKNSKVIKIIIKLSSNRGETVLDPFCGGGTIPLCALDLGRKAIGIEILEKHYETCMERYKEFKKNPKLDFFTEDKDSESSLEQFLH